MKKLLAILGTIAISSTGASLVIACDNPAKKENKSSVDKPGSKPVEPTNSGSSETSNQGSNESSNKKPENTKPSESDSNNSTTLVDPKRPDQPDTPKPKPGEKEKEIKDNNDKKDNSSQGDTSNLDKNNSKNPESKDNFQPNHNSSGTNSHNNTNEKENLPNDEGYKEPKKDDFETSKISNKLELSLNNKIDKKAKKFAQKVDDLVENEKFSDIKKMLVDYFNMVIKKVKESEKSKKQTNLEIYQSLPLDKIKELKQPISSLLEELFKENLILDLEENNKKEIETFVQEIETLINKEQKDQIQSKLFDLVDQITELEEELKNISI